MMQKFVQPRVQRILRNITGLNLEKIFSSQPTSRLRAPKYLFLTDEDYEKSLNAAKSKARYFLKMPPILEPYKDDVKTYEKDEKLEGYVDEYGHSNYNLVFVDISPGFSDRSRTMAIREPDGTLRRASRKERDRFNQIYFPKKYKKSIVPKMFGPENLEKLLKKEDILFFILDRALLQFECDDEEYIRITNRVYEHILDYKLFDELRSTKFFGPMAFYYAANQKIDYLLKDMIERNLIEDAVQLIELYYILNDKNYDLLKNKSSNDIIEHFIQNDANDKTVLKPLLEVISN